LIPKLFWPGRKDCKAACGRSFLGRAHIDVEDGHGLFDSSGFVCDDDIAAITGAATLAIGVSL
jgi:hypothetical protein